jgi:hypothetical protein
MNSACGNVDAVGIDLDPRQRAGGVSINSSTVCLLKRSSRLASISSVVGHRQAPRIVAFGTAASDSLGDIARVTSTAYAGVEHEWGTSTEGGG